MTLCSCCGQNPTVPGWDYCPDCEARYTEDDSPEEPEPLHLHIWAKDKEEP